MDVAASFSRTNDGPEDEVDLEAGISVADLTMVATGAKPAHSLLPEMALGTTLVAAGVVVGFCGLSSTLTSPVIVDFSSVSTALFAPYAAHQHHRVKKLSPQRTAHAQLRSSIDRFEHLNKELSGSIDQFQDKINRLSKVEARFQDIVATSKLNVDSILALCKATALVQAQMENILKARLVQDVLSNILMVDRSEDFHLNDNEMEVLIIRMGMQHGVRFHEDSFRKKLTQTNDRSIRTIMAIFRNLLDDNPDDDHHLFSIDTNVLQ